MARHKPAARADERMPRLSFDARGYSLAKFGRRQVRFGHQDDPQTRARFEQALAAWLANGRRMPDAAPSAEAVTLGEVAQRYESHAETYYRDRDGLPTSSLRNTKRALVPLKEQPFASLPVTRFDVGTLKAFRQAWLDGGLCRKTINAQVGVVRRCLAWAVEERLAPAMALAEARALRNLQPFRSAARETDARQPVPWADVDSCLPHLSRQVAGLVLAGWWSGARMGELVQLRTRDVDMSGAVWTFTVPKHKGSWRMAKREIDFGAEAQRVLRPFVKLAPDATWFDPREADVESDARRRERFERARATKGRKLPPSVRRRLASKLRGAKADRAPGEVYDVRAVGQAIERACRRAGVPHWSPHRLRHAALTRIRKELGIEAAVAIGGHGSAAVTESYSTNARRELARAVAAQLG